MHDFDDEEMLIDSYVEIKDSTDASNIAAELIEKYFLPQARFEEARSWRNVIKDGNLKAEIDALIVKAAKTIGAVSITRIPQNKDWRETPITGKSKTSEDQQYHYNRTLGYLVASNELADSAEDVATCRNEWITFVARNAYSGGLEGVGAELDTIAMAVSDYIENFLLVPQSDAQSASTISVLPAVSEALASRIDIINLLQSKMPSILQAGFISKIVDSQTSISGGQLSEILFTDAGIVLMPRNRRDGVNGVPHFIPFETVSNISIGGEVHTEHAGFTSTTTEYWILEIYTTDYQSHSRWLLLGSNENEINRNRPPIMKALKPASEFYQIVEGDSWQTSGGFQTSFGFGVIW